MRNVWLRAVLVFLVTVLGAMSFGLWGALLGLLLGSAGLVVMPRALRSAEAFAPH